MSLCKCKDCGWSRPARKQKGKASELRCGFGYANTKEDGIGCDAFISKKEFDKPIF